MIKSDFKIVSGFGLGVGSAVINGVLKEVYVNRKENLNNQLLLRPFPQGDEFKKQWEDYRKDMISYAGISIFIFGNKIENGKLVSADGVEKEFEIALNQNCLLIPVGATDFKSKELWEKVLSKYDIIFGSNENIKLFEKLGDDKLEPAELIEIIIKFIQSNN